MPPIASAPVPATPSASTNPAAPVRMAFRILAPSLPPAQTHMGRRRRGAISQTERAKARTHLECAAWSTTDWPALFALRSELAAGGSKRRLASPFHVFPPVVLLLEAERFARLAVRQGRLPLAQRPRDRRIGAIALQELGSGDICGDRVVGGVEHLEAEPVLLQAAMDDLAEIARVDIGPGVALARQRIGEEGREAIVFVRLDHVADAQGVDVGAVAHGESASGLFVDDLGEAVRIHRVDIVVFFKREALEVLVAFGEADAIGRLARGDDDL